MKKVLICAMAFLLLLLVACTPEAQPTGSKKDPGAKPKPSQSQIQIPSTSTSPTQGEIDPSNWGKSENVRTDDGNIRDRYYINVPNYRGIYHGCGLISEQLDGTVVCIYGEDPNDPEPKQVRDIFETYLAYTIESLEDLYGMGAKNFNITIDISEPVTIGDYEMYVHSGVITYDFRDTHRSHQYVAYATKLKDSGHCAYWIVYDFSDDQSKGDLIAQHALNMAKTFREEE